MDKVLNINESSEKDLEIVGLKGSVAGVDSEPTAVLKETADKPSIDSVFVVERVVNGSVCTVKSSRSSFTCETEEIEKQPITAPSISKDNFQASQPAESDVQIVEENPIDCTDNLGNRCLKILIATIGSNHII
jgi:hypothetical protein